MSEYKKEFQLDLQIQFKLATPQRLVPKQTKSPIELNEDVGNISLD